MQVAYYFVKATRSWSNLDQIFTNNLEEKGGP